MTARIDAIRARALLPAPRQRRPPAPQSHASHTSSAAPRRASAGAALLPPLPVVQALGQAAGAGARIGARRAGGPGGARRQAGGHVRRHGRDRAPHLRGGRCDLRRGLAARAQGSVLRLAPANARVGVGGPLLGVGMGSDTPARPRRASAWRRDAPWGKHARPRQPRAHRCAARQAASAAEKQAPRMRSAASISAAAQVAPRSARRPAPAGPAAVCSRRGSAPTALPAPQRPAR